MAVTERGSNIRIYTPSREQSYQQLREGESNKKQYTYLNPDLKS